MGKSKNRKEKRPGLAEKQARVRNVVSMGYDPEWEDEAIGKMAECEQHAAEKAALRRAAMATSRHQHVPPPGAPAIPPAAPPAMAPLEADPALAPPAPPAMAPLEAGPALAPPAEPAPAIAPPAVPAAGGAPVV
nr:WW domain-binding protein 11-like [Aegilops tauschii subsp. strangulata]